MKNLAVSANITIRDAMKLIGASKYKCLAVVDKKEKLLGTLAYSDLRKSILSGAVFNSTIEKSYNHKPITLVEGRFDEKDVQELLKNPEIKMIPIIDDSGRYVNYLSWDNGSVESGKVEHKKLKSPVIIMAGGRGARLDPFTKLLPKPLLPINEKPVIEHIIERFTACAVDNFMITVNYKSRILKAYFEDLNPDYSVQFIEEKEPLGTAGGLKSLSGKIHEPFLVTNCDIIIDTDYSDFLDFHLNYGYDISLVASIREYVIPYGTCELNAEGHLDHINEKPEYHFLVNTGMYFINPTILELIPKNKMYHITDLIEDAKQKNLKIGVYPISEEAYVDVGQWDEYHKSVGKF
tara:strand:- start:461 stop:1510 length:1050 start_codon:yes stop_codon:yes gene_type:complete